MRLEPIKLTNESGGAKRSYLGNNILPHRNGRSQSLLHQERRRNGISLDDVAEGVALDDN